MRSIRQPNGAHPVSQRRPLRLSCSFQKETFACEQKETWLKDRTMEENDGFGLLGWGLTEVIDVAIGTQAADDFGPRWRINGLALGADGDFAVVTDADRGLLAPDKGPPRASRGWPQHRALLGKGLEFGLVRGSAQLAMEFMLVGMRQELIQKAVSSIEFADAICSQQGGKAFLPVIVAAFDFAFGLGSGGEAEGDSVEVEGGAKLGEGVWGMGEEEGVVVDVECQGQAVEVKRAGQEVEVSQEGFCVVEAGADIVPGGIIQ